MTPELTFIADNSMKHGVEIAAVLNGLNISHDDGDDADTEDGEDD
jgi:ribosome-binding factor A